MIEAGLGGRYDATNVLDAAGRRAHQRRARAHALARRRPSPTSRARSSPWCRPGATLVLGDADPEVRGAGARRPARGSCGREPLDVPLRGYQRANFELAAAAARPPHRRADARRRGRRAASRARDGCRSSASDPLTIVDGAHNPAGMAALAAALPDVVGDRPLVAVVSVLDDKDAAGMLRALLGKCAARGLHRLAQPARAAARHARLARRAARRPSPRSCATRARRWRAPASWPARTARCWRRARSTSSPI